MDTVIADWTDRNAAAFGSDVLPFRHVLHQRPMFSDTALAEVLDRYPRDKLGVFTMGVDLTDWRSWRRGEAGDLSGAELMQAVSAGRLWLNLRHANQHLPEYAALCAEICEDKERHVPGLKTLRRDLGLLISSPRAHVFYHLDVPLSSLWQVRGHKRIWFYPRSEPYVADAQIERFVRRQAEGQLAFRPEWDAAARALDLKPGDMVNVSLSLEFMTPAALFRADVLYANGLLRQYLGWNAGVQTDWGPAAAAKLAIAGVAKAARRWRKPRPILPACFMVEPPPPEIEQIQAVRGRRRAAAHAPA